MKTKEHLLFNQPLLHGNLCSKLSTGMSASELNREKKIGNVFRNMTFSHIFSQSVQVPHDIFLPTG